MSDTKDLVRPDPSHYSDNMFRYANALGGYASAIEDRERETVSKMRHALTFLMEQVLKCDPVDDLGHEFKMNLSVKDVHNALIYLDNIYGKEE